MTTELQIRIWMDTDAKEGFLQLVEALAAWPVAEAKFRGLELCDPQFQIVRELSAAMTPHALREGFRGMDADELRFSTAQVLPAWRFNGSTPEDGQVRMGIEGWGSRWRERDRRIEGDLGLWFQSAGPFLALLNESEAAQRVNTLVEENVEMLLDLAQHVIRSMAPQRMTAWTSAGLSLPVNAHFSWFKERALILEDFSWMRTLWLKGLPMYNIGPLQDWQTAHDRLPLHSWRSDVQRRRLWEQLAIGLERDATLEAVNNVLMSGKFDFYDLDQGIFLLNYPHPLNGFIDDFYIAVLAGL